MTDRIDLSYTILNSDGRVIGRLRSRYAAAVVLWLQGRTVTHRGRTLLHIADFPLLPDQSPDYFTAEMRMAEEQVTP